MANKESSFNLPICLYQCGFMPLSSKVKKTDVLISVFFSSFQYLFWTVICNPFSLTNYHFILDIYISNQFNVYMLLLGSC